jgi:hypothetical protein
MGISIAPLSSPVGLFSLCLLGAIGMGPSLLGVIPSSQFQFLFWCTVVPSLRLSPSTELA